MKKNVMFLVHRLPFPPDKGDKIRSYHLLRHLSEHYAVHLGCFIDDPNDEQYMHELEPMCASVHVCKLNPLFGRLRSVTGLLTRQALSVPYYFDAEFARWVQQVFKAKDIASIVAYSSPMAQYAMGPEFRSCRRIMDFVDVDSDKWAQYAAKKSFPLSWVYSRESRRLLEFDRAVAEEFDASIFVTGEEVALFSGLVPEVEGKLYAVPNGVATDYFDPAVESSSPYPDNVQAVVFTGMMDYWANVDAVTWFAKEVFPAIRANHPESEFWIVGGAPTNDVQELGQLEGVQVTGRVPDVRPYLKHSACVVAPLRIARGIQNKVLEALAMGRHVVCTTQAATGIGDAQSPPPVNVADEADEFARDVSVALRNGADATSSSRAREYAVQHYGWGRALELFENVHSTVAS
jgi:sugar transferase (PEP-CTERM/EpsH1 system associated)